VIFKLKILIKR